MANEYLSRTPTVAGNRRTFTISFWSKFALPVTNEKFFSTATGAGTNAASFFLMTESTGQLHAGAYYSAGGGWANDQQTAPNLRDTSAWYHIVCAVDTTQATSTNRIKLYVNNVLQAKTSGTDPVLNFQYDVNNTVAQYIASAGADLSANFTGNMSDFFLIDGLALDPSYFGKVDTHKNNQWVAKHPTAIRTAINSAGGFGTNGCYLPLSSTFKLTTTGAGAHRYWRYVEGSALVSHHPRVARLYFVKIDGTKTNIATFASDNNSDTGSITPGTQTFDFTTPVEVVGHGGYVAYNGLRSSNCTIQYSDNNSTWTTAYTSTFQATDFGEHDFHPQIGFDFKTADRSSKNDWIIYGPTANKHAPLDSITNNFATMNANAGYDGAQSKGGLVQTGMNDCLASMGFRSGKYYWEHKILVYPAGGVVLHFGFKNIDYNSAASSINGAAGFIYRNDGNIYRVAGNSCSSWSGSDVTGGTSSGVGDIVGIAVDLTTTPASVTVYKNGTSIYSYTFTYTPTQYYIIPYVRNNSPASSEQNFGQGTFVTSNNGAGYTDTNGKGKFQYAPPSGFLSVCEDNLPDPSIVPKDNFNMVTWAGNGGTQSITGLTFKPDFVWAKVRGSTASWYHRLWDSVRGTGRKGLYINTGETEGTWEQSGVAGYDQDQLTSFDSNGFTVVKGPDGDGLNASGYNYIAYCWKGGNATTTNTSGSVTTNISANNTAGFSIVTWSGTGVYPSTFGTGLDDKSTFSIIKERNASANGWWAYIGRDDPAWRWQVNGNGAATADNIDAINHTVSGKITITQAWNDVGKNYVIYTWKAVPGFSAFGTYVGNGSSTSAPFVYTGFRPAFVMIRSTAGDHMAMFDNVRSAYNGAGNDNAQILYANLTTEGTDSIAVDFYANGFKLRGATAQTRYNGNGTQYVYMAFAETPQDFANAK